MTCPICGSEGPFQIAVRASAIIGKSGLLDLAGVCWSDSDQASCLECDFEGVANDFREESFELFSRN